MRSYTKTSLYCILFCLLITLVCADTFSVQGVLRDPLGKTVSDGFYSITIRLYDQDTGGAPLWEETQSSVQVLHGVYNIEVGSVIPMTGLPFNTTYWLGLSIEGGPELEPRFKLLKSPAAMSVLGVSNVFPSTGPVGVGTFAPDAALNIIAGPSDAKLHIAQSNGSDILMVDAAGNMGVRVSSPTEALDIDGNLKMRNGGAILFDDGSSLNSAYFGGTSSSLSNNFDINITADYDANNSGDILLKIGPDTTIAVKNTGKVGIGKTNPQSLLDVDGEVRAVKIEAGDIFYGYSWPLQVVSGSPETAYFMNYSNQVGASAVYSWAPGPDQYAGYFVGNVHYTGTLSGPSDRKFKTHIQPLQNALEKVRQLQVHTFDFKHSGEAEKLNLPAGLQFGFVAQELSQVFPELVKDEYDIVENHDGQDGSPRDPETIQYKGVNQIGMIPVLTAAIQEQQEEIEAQNALINDLLQRVEALENR